jgi:threonine dehydrogenase-like Zn-dependent dehydrogenase
MKAITVEPGKANSLHLEERPEPPSDPALLLVQAIALGICGIDRAIVAGTHGSAPPGGSSLVLGHESFGRVLQAPSGSGFSRGDVVVGIVRRPDPVPCPACGHGEWDMCRNGLYGERGIKALDGYGAERFLLEPEFAVQVASALGLLGVLLEPASVVAKAWEHIDRIGRRAHGWRPRSALITGTGPVGLLAALMGRQRGLAVHVLGWAEAGAKPALVRALGASYHCRTLPDDLDPDITVECTGASDLAIDMLCRSRGSAGIVCLAGASSGARAVPFDSGRFNRSMVLQNDVVLGAAGANRLHYLAAARALAAADPRWLGRLIARRVPLASWREAFERRKGDIKVVLLFEDGAG